MKKWPFVTLILFIVVALLATGCSKAEEPVAQAAAPVEPVAEAAAPAEVSAVSVLVATAHTGSISLVYSYSGDLKAKDSVNLLPMSAGRIQSVLVKVGDSLKAGDPMAIVESKTYSAQLKQAEANLELARLSITKMEDGTRPEQIAAAQAAVQFARNAVNDVNTISGDERTAAAAAMAQTEAALRLAQSRYDEVAWAGQVGMLPQSLQLEQATVAYQAARAAYDLQTNPSDVQLSPLMIQLAQAEMTLALARQPFTTTDFDLARGKVKLAEAALDLARIQMDETTIRAPFDGVVAELYIAEGGMVGSSSPAALFVSGQLEAVVNIEESRITQIRDGQNAALRVNAYPGEDFPAVVTSVAPVADNATHTFVVKVTPVDEAGKLRAGMYADLSLLVEEKQSALLVPRTALTLINDKQSVYVVTDNVAAVRQVTTGLSDHDNVEVLSGLRPDETVVTAGQANLTDGAQVAVVSTGGQPD
jgi:HlyD family secretion protein